MPIKTYDGAELAMRALRRYPEGSVSPREVLLTIPVNGDVNQFDKLNATITHAIFKKAEDYIKHLPPKEKGLKFSAVADLKVKVDDREQRNAELTVTVLAACTDYA